MKTHHDASSGERTGAAFARALRRLLRQERRVIAWLVSMGWSSTIAKCVVRAVELVVLCAVLYAASWLALLLAFVLAAAWLARSVGDEDNDAPEWRNGVMGFGMYARDGHRIDPHDVEDEE